jgi:hypothetical protein
MTEGETVAGPGAPAATIVASDIYEWGTGGMFVLHTAYGRIGPVGVGGVEIITYDSKTKTYPVYFFDSQGNVSIGRLSHRNGVWTWQGEHTRCNATFSADGKTLPAHHERSDDGIHWVPSMEVTLRRID